MIAALLAALPVPLPPGRLVAPGGGGPPAYWLSDGPPDAELVAVLRAGSAASGLQPLLVSGLSGPGDPRPWAAGEVYPRRMSSPGGHDAEALLARWWRNAAPEEDDEILAPFDATWPGLATPGTPPADPNQPAEGPGKAARDPGQAAEGPGKAASDPGQTAEGPGQAARDPDRAAGDLAAALLAEPRRLALIAAGSGADALAVAGWSGPTNHTADTGQIAAVLRTWQDRFGARVVGAGFDNLQVSVAVPPITAEHALRVAVEHFAFCPDLVHQGTGSLTEYAEELPGATAWWFWWD